jgi:hypothetical protein
MHKMCTICEICTLNIYHMHNMLNMSKYVLYVKYTQYVKYVKYNQKKLNWYTKSSTWFCVLSSWTRVSRKQTRRRPQCHSRVLPLKLSSVPPPPLEGGRRVRRPLSVRRVEVSWLAACAWPVLHRRVDLRDIHTLLRTTEPLFRCMYCDRLTDSCAHPPLSQDADLHCRRMLTMFLEPRKESLRALPSMDRRQRDLQHHHREKSIPGRNQA